MGAALLVAPNLLAQFGFQLSVAATAGILLGHRLFTAWDSRLAQPLAATISAQVAVAPLLLIRSGEVPLIAPLANLVAAPLVALATLLSALGIVLPIPTLARLGAGSIADVVLDLARALAWFPQTRSGICSSGTSLLLLAWRFASWRWLAALGARRPGGRAALAEVLVRNPESFSSMSVRVTPHSSSTRPGTRC